MNLAELERYSEVFDKLKDNYKEFPNGKVAVVIVNYFRKAVKDRTNDDGLSYLIANAIRKHRGLNFPVYFI